MSHRPVTWDIKAREAELRRVYLEAHNKSRPVCTRSYEDDAAAEIVAIDAGIAAVLKAIDGDKSHVSA